MLLAALVPQPASPPTGAHVRRVCLMPRERVTTYRTPVERRGLIVKTLRESGPGTTTELSLDLAVRFEQMSKDLKALEKKGAVHRTTQPNGTNIWHASADTTNPTQGT